MLGPTLLPTALARPIHQPAAASLAGTVPYPAISPPRPDTALHFDQTPKLQSDTGRAAYRRRKWIAELPNGWIKNVLGFRQFSLRGLHRVQAEWKLVCLALNLRRMAGRQPA
jgi:hypothetical protein